MKVVYGRDPVTSGPAEKIETLAPAKTSAPSGITITSTMTSEESGAETPIAEDVDANSYCSGKRLKKGQNKVDKLDLLIEHMVKSMKFEEEEKEARQAEETARREKTEDRHKRRDEQIDKMVSLMDKFVMHMVNQ